MAFVCACAGGGPAPAPTTAGAASVPAFTSPLDRDHPLVGRIWDTAQRRFVAEDELIARAAAAQLLVLGERHDNADHHRLQAHVLERLRARGRAPALVFEMLDASDQSAIDRVLAEASPAPEALAAAVNWAQSGWPPFALYRPLFALALRQRWPIVAAGLPRGAAMHLARDPASLDPTLAQRFGLAEPLAPAVNDELRAEMRDAHCGLMPEAMLGAMVLIQRVRDAQFAQHLHDAAARNDGAVLITGNGHARNDRGVPAALARAFGDRALSIAIEEVHGDQQEPDAYGDARGAAKPTLRLPVVHAAHERRRSLRRAEEEGSTAKSPQDAKLKDENLCSSV